jgi:hypothetical protein
MYSTKLHPDFNKLKAYFRDITDQIIDQVEANQGVPIHLEYQSEDRYNDLSYGLKIVLNDYNIEDHFSELLYLILKKNEDIRKRYDVLWTNYNDDKTSKEVASFLLAYKQSKSNQQFQLVLKPITGSVTIKNTEIARWMTDVIYNAIERKEFPLGTFGSKIMQDLFGDNPFDVDEISIERLEAASKKTAQKPTKRISQLHVELCLYLQTYLIHETHLTIPENVMLTDAHANFFFDVLELLEYLDRNEIESEPKDYMHAMFRNRLR